VLVGSSRGLSRVLTSPWLECRRQRRSPAVADDLVQQVPVLDKLVLYRFGHELMGARSSSRNELGPFTQWRAGGAARAGCAERREVADPASSGELRVGDGWAVRCFFTRRLPPSSRSRRWRSPSACSKSRIQGPNPLEGARNPASASPLDCHTVRAKFRMADRCRKNAPACRKNALACFASEMHMYLRTSDPIGRPTNGLWLRISGGPTSV